MSQYGAQGAAQAGLTAKQILDFYYPNTNVSTIGGEIRVHLTGDTTSNVTVGAVDGLRVRDIGDNSVHNLGRPAGITQWEIRPHGELETRLFYLNAGRWVQWAGDPFVGMAQFEGPAVIPLVLPNGTQRFYRGKLRAADRTGAALDTINELNLELYLRGVVPREAFTTWRPAALQSQAVAARTYAAFHRDRSTSRDYDLCDTIACQVYGGYNDEVTSTNQAIAATNGSIRVRQDNGDPIIAEFSSSNGGYTVRTEGIPYQIAKADPYDGRAGNGNPNHTWTKVVNRAEAEAALEVGTLKRLVVTERDGFGTWGGRVLSIDAVGSAGTKTYTGNQFRFRLKLKSNWVAPAQSEIIRRWAAIGGSSSPVGSIVGDEFVVRGGAGHKFTKGRIYRGNKGSWEVHGPIGARYAAIGGPNHRIGLPVYRPAFGSRPGSTVQAFGGGRFFHSAATNAREVTGPIYFAYYRIGFERSRLRLPTSPEAAWSGGTRQIFQGGYINWYRATNTTRVVYY